MNLILALCMHLSCARATDTWRWGELNDTTSLILVKPTKVGGSTVAGVVRRIAAHHNLDGFTSSHFGQLEEKRTTDKLCTRSQGYVSANHGTRTEFTHTMRACHQSGKPLFVMTWVRDALIRCLSAFYHFQVSRLDVSPTVENKLDYCGSRSNDHFKNYLSNSKGAASADEEAVADAFASFHFVGVAERFDESMLVLRDILGLSMSDILYLPSKNSSSLSNTPTGKFDQQHNNTQVAHPPLSKEPDAVQQLERSPQWQTQHKWSLQFIRLANERLNRLIENIGKDEFEQNLKRYKQLLLAAKQKCGGDLVAQSTCYFKVSTSVEYRAPVIFLIDLDQRECTVQ
eukprot:m.141317 g.141317  ORF g.141317 m.141317 type:complete len:343 (-) comp30179_c1_seq4:434-1462(-)